MAASTQADRGTDLSRATSLEPEWGRGGDGVRHHSSRGGDGVDPESTPSPLPPHSVPTPSPLRPHSVPTPSPPRPHPVPPASRPNRVTWVDESKDAWDGFFDPCNPGIRVGQLAVLESQGVTCIDSVWTPSGPRLDPVWTPSRVRLESVPTPLST